MRISGRCHCGTISFELLWKPDPAEIPARACGCTFCVRHGAAWTANPAAELEVRVRAGAPVSRYTFGTRTAEFHVCTRCGVSPVVTSRIDGQLYAVVNVNVFEGVEPMMIHRAPASFDGEEAGARLERRKRQWISRVKWTEAPPEGS